MLTAAAAANMKLGTYSCDDIDDYAVAQAYCPHCPSAPTVTLISSPVDLLLIDFIARSSSSSQASKTGRKEADLTCFKHWIERT
jgi:hypothetical protein